MASNRPGFYRSEVGYPSPTSSQNLGSNKAQYLPIMAKIHYYRHKNQIKIQKHYNKTHFMLIVALIPLSLGVRPPLMVM
jgi:hypothetical protein